MIRLEVVAKTVAAAEELASLLALDEQIEIVAAQALTLGYRRAAGADVIVALQVSPPETPGRGPAVVLLSSAAPRRLRMGSAVRARLRPDTPAIEIVAAAVAAAAGLFALTPEQLLLQGVDSGSEDDGVQEKLTTRELEVLRWMADGSGNKAIAAGLGISSNTAKFHVAQVMAKLGASSRTEAVRLGIRRGLVSI